MIENLTAEIIDRLVRRGCVSQTPREIRPISKQQQATVRDGTSQVRSEPCSSSAQLACAGVHEHGDALARLQARVREPEGAFGLPASSPARQDTDVASPAHIDGIVDWYNATSNHWLTCAWSIHVPLAEGIRGRLWRPNGAKVIWGTLRAARTPRRH
jgi:hypothetical protein